MKLLSKIAVIAALLPAAVYAQQPNPTYIQVDGNKAAAIKVLKESGFRAKDTIKQKFALPDVTVTGADKPIELGEQATLYANIDTDTLSEGLVSITFNWTVIDNGKLKSFFSGPDGKSIAFAGGIKPKTIVVTLGITCVFETKQKFTVVDKDGKNPTEKEFITEVKVNSPTTMFVEVNFGTGVNPNPTPDNPIDPIKPVVPIVPVFPDGQFGLAKFMYSSFASDTNLDQASKVMLAGKLADGLEGIASKIVAISNYKDIPVILADTKTANTFAFSSLSIDLSKTVALKTIIGNKISELWKNQKINTAADIAIAWQEMSQGLRAVK